MGLFIGFVLFVLLGTVDVMLIVACAEFEKKKGIYFEEKMAFPNNNKR